jgi:hypothetical protein
VVVIASAAWPDPLPGDADWWAFGDHRTGQGLVGWVYALGVHDGQLIAGGPGYWLPGENPGEYIDGGYIYAWDGSRWHSLQGGVFGEQFDGQQYVRALTEFRGELIAGGRFKYANGLGTGLSTVVNNIARWDGTRWHAMGTGMNDVVSSLTVYNDELIASGVFTVAGGEDVNYIARWDGFRWRPIGEGLGGDARDYVVYDGDLLAVGVFALASAERIDGIARWDGVEWSAFGSQELAYPASSVTVLNDALVANILYPMNQSLVPLVSTWNGAEWVPLGAGSAARLGEVADFAVHNGELYAAGAVFYPLTKISITSRDGTERPSRPSARELNPVRTSGVRTYWRFAFTAAVCSWADDSRMPVTELRP